MPEPLLVADEWVVTLLVPPGRPVAEMEAARRLVARLLQAAVVVASVAVPVGELRLE